MLSARRLLAFAACLLSGALGCAQWSPNASSSWTLPATSATPDSVAIEIATISLPDDADGPLARLWQQADEQIFPIEMRRRLAANGLRCAVVHGELPHEITELMDRAGSYDGKISEDILNADEDRAKRQTFQERTGRRRKIIAAPVREQLSVLTPDGERIVGRTYDYAQCLFSLKSFPHGDGRVRFELTPEIEHGTAKQRWVGEAHDGIFRLDAGRDRVQFEQLRFEPTLSPGQTLLVTTTADHKGLGGHFFSERTVGGSSQRLLLIRPRPNGLDELFAPSITHEPLVTPTD